MSKQIIPTIGTLIILAALGWYVDSVAHDDIVWTIRTGLYAVVTAVILTVAGISILSVLLFREKFLKSKAVRKQMEREAEVHAIISDVHGIFVREMNPKATWRPLHLNPATYQNGKQAQISPVDIAQWQTWQALHAPRATNNIPQQQALLLPAPVDLLMALDSVQRCLIVGASDSGKTTLLQWIIARRLVTSRVIVIDPHAYPGKWSGKVIGTGRDYEKIGYALEGLVQLMTKRYDDIGKGIVAEMGHNRLTIIIDEWRAIVGNVKGAADCIKTLLTESRKAAFSVFVATHSERVRALGLEGEGDLKDGFTFVRISVVNGIRQATIDKGEGEQPATLPGPFQGHLVKVVEPDEIINLQAEPNETEARVLALFDQGESISNIAALIYGSKGGPQNKKVEAVLSKFSKV